MKKAFKELRFNTLSSINWPNETQIRYITNERMCNLNLAKNREILNRFVVISNKINHLMRILSQLLSIHWLQPATLPTELIHQTNKTTMLIMS